MHDRRRSQIAKCSAIVCDHMETHFCDRLRSCDRDRRAIVCDQLRPCDHMETKVLRSAIETYPIVFWIPTHDSMLFSNKATAYLKTWLALSKVTLITRNL